MNKDEIEARALELYPERKRQNKKGTGEYDANLPRRKAYIKGWTDAQPTLPEDSPLAPQVASGTCVWCGYDGHELLKDGTENH